MLPVIILAAGESKRMGRPKATLPFRGSTFIRSIIGLYEAERIEPIIVVIGAHAAEVVDDIRTMEVTAVMNESFMDGQLSSILAGISSVEHLNPSGVIIHPVDHPCVARETVREMAVRWETASTSLLLPAFRGKRGHPIIVGSALFRELKEAPSVTGMRAVVWADPNRVAVIEVNDPGILQNIDTPEGYENIT